VPLILKKSSSATVESATKVLPLEIPVFVTAAVPRPSDVLAVAPDSATKLAPSPTIKLPSLGQLNLLHQQVEHRKLVRLFQWLNQEKL
jgi:hypothetical protein